MRTSPIRSRSLAHSTLPGCAVLAGLLIAGGVGCSSVKRPTAELAAANTALAKADEAQAAAQSPLPLKNARDKLGAANQVVDNDDKDKDERHTNARRLAEEARADADLAEAQARAKAARRSADELRIAIEAVRRESGVGGGSYAPARSPTTEPSSAPPAYPPGGSNEPLQPLPPGSTSAPSTYPSYPSSPSATPGR